MKKIISILLIMTVIFATSITTFASGYSENLGEIIDGSLLTDEASSEKILESRTRGNFLDGGMQDYRITEMDP